MTQLWHDIKLLYLRLQCRWAIRKVDRKLAQLEANLRQEGYLEKNTHD
jgi:hypothetical protein